jgi:hypothetical protein
MLVVGFAAGITITVALTTLFTTGIWYTATLFEATLLYRGLKAGLLRKYPLFYSYIFVVFAAEILRIVTFRLANDSYTVTYWPTQFIALLFGSAVMFEVYRKGLVSYPGTARIARNILFLVFALLLAKSIVLTSAGNVWAWVSETPFELERDLRIVQALAIASLVAIFLIYSIPVGRNLKGILIGYGLFVASGVIQLTLASKFLSAIQTAWSYAQPLTYILVLGIWISALWSYQPAKERIDKAEPPVDYEFLASSTRGQFGKASAELAKAVRQ